MDGGRRGKMSPWIKHVMSFKKPGMSLGDAMKAAKPSWKSTKKGGQMMGKAGPMGGRRTRKHKGGQLYSFAGGPYTGSVLSDGAAPTQRLPDATWKGNPALLSGGAYLLRPRPMVRPSTPASAEPRRKRKTKKGSAYLLRPRPMVRPSTPASAEPRRKRKTKKGSSYYGGQQLAPASVGGSPAETPYSGLPTSTPTGGR